jgi:hypothetical protein
MSRRSVQSLGAIAVVGAALILVWSAISTSSARVTATTSGESFFAAGTVSLAQPDAAVEMLFDADGLYPGSDVTGCVEIEYTGSVPASIRLHANTRGGTGLETYIDLTLGIAVDGDCESDVAGGTGVDTIFDARLGSLWTRHPNYDGGIVVQDPARPQDRFALHAVASVADDNQAQGLTTDFSITIEARP